MAATPLLFYDLGSPYAYLAVERAERVLGAPPELRPVLLGAIFAARGRGSWSQTPARAAGMAEVERRAAAYGLEPLRWPDGWPANTLAAMRAAVWAEREGRGAAFAHAAFRRAYAGGADLADVAVLAEAAGAAGLDAPALPAAIAAPAIKDDLRSRTEAAIALGVRGVPTLAAGGRLFYGDDHLEDAAAHALERPRKGTAAPGRP
jgi:2-hydroxychromene-2-carboxylate isomerase